jgi:predicted ATPase
MWLARAEVMRGWALARAGSTEDGIPLLHRGSAAYLATGAALWLPYFSALLTDVEAPSAQTLKGLDEALARAERTGERWLEPDLYRRKGEALLAFAPDRAAEAEACHAQALALACRREARFWELRAAVSLARLYRDRGRRGEARALLAPIYGWFSEGLDTPDLIEAKALHEAMT